MLERRQMVYSPYPGILLERAVINAKLMWLVWWFIVDEQPTAGGFNPRYVLPSLGSNGEELNSEGLKNPSVNLQWIEEDELRKMIEE